MADDTITDAPATGDVVVTVPTDLGDAGKQAIDRMKAERDVARKEAKANADAAKRLVELEDRQKSEAQRLAERAETAEKAAAEQAGQLARYKVAAETSVPAHLLAGSDEESIAQHAADLLAWRESTVTEPARLTVDIDQGARPGPMALNGDPLLDSLKNKLGIR